MLLEFRAKNYKSYKDELVFSMLPAPRQKGLDYSVLKQKIGTVTYKALCSAILYGPNASGKTNIIGAMDTFKSIVLRGNIHNGIERDSPNAAASNAIMLGYAIDHSEAEAKLQSIFDRSGKGHGVAIPADVFESHGTFRFINIFPLVISAILNGGTLVVDEFDASIHPMALMSITNIFHNDEINVNKAQIIFNTHNPIFLNSNLFRRDELKFTERDDETGYSVQYSLSDFGTSGENGIRKNEDYLKNYFVSQYGAIKDIDFTPIFESLFDGQKEL